MLINLSYLLGTLSPFLVLCKQLAEQAEAEQRDNIVPVAGGKAELETSPFQEF